MEELLKIIENNKVGFFLLLFSFVVVMHTIRRFIQSFGIIKGYEKRLLGKLKLQGVISHIILGLVNQFRHLLATIVIISFLILIILIMFVMGNDRMEALQLALSAFSGILGTIVGFYFSEKLKEKKSSPDEVTEDDLEQGDVDDDTFEPVDI